MSTELLTSQSNYILFNDSSILSPLYYNVVEGKTTHVFNIHLQYQKHPPKNTRHLIFRKKQLTELLKIIASLRSISIVSSFWEIRTRLPGKKFNPLYLF